MKRYRIVLAYDGTRYAGYQLQENGVAVQQRLEEALAYVNRAPVRVFGCSRTDAGVHARGFCAHVDLDVPIPPKNLVRAMNARLPDDIRVMRAAFARPDFNARNDAKGKEYRYFVYQADILPPHLAPFWTFCHRPLDLAAMLETPVRTIFAFTVRRSGPRYTFSVKGDGFLYKQVRSMVGFLLSVGKGNEKPAAVTELLAAAAPRTARVETAPGRGLFLWKVWYR